MRTLVEYLLSVGGCTQPPTIIEGGQSGHMAHIIDYDDFTRDDLIELVEHLFDGKIEDVTEKIDGTNIQATMNHEGEVVFIRNKTDLNSERGGMSIQDMVNKWVDKPSVMQTFITAGQTIQKVFNKIGKDFFNPDSETRLVVNCECVIAGKTNIIPYASDQVDFHNIWIYKRGIAGWKQDDVTKDGLKTIEKACEGIDGAQLTPKVIIQVTKDSERLKNQYIKEINKLFRKNLTISEWKYDRYFELINKEYKWLLDGRYDELYARWFNGDKKMNLRELKKIYADHVDELVALDKKGYKDIVGTVIEPLDILFLKLGNDVIRMCKGLINGGANSEVINQLKRDMEDIVKDVEKEGTEEVKQKLAIQMARMMNIGGEDSINSAEGIVFSYKGKLMKATGSFATMNQILGLRFIMK